MKLNLLKTMLVAAAGLLMSMGDAFAAAPTLTESLEITGYVKSHYYDFVNYKIDGESFSTENQTLFGGLGLFKEDGTTRNSPDFRDDWGLYNYASGARTFTINEKIAVGDIIIIEGLAGNTSYELSISASCGETTTIAGVDHLCFNVTSDVESYTISMNRANYIRAILVLSKDANADELAVSKANYSSALTAYSNAKENAVIDEKYIDDNKLFWHPTSAKTTYDATIADIEKSYNAALVNENETNAAVYDVAVATINDLVASINSAVSTYNSDINMPEEGKYYAIKQTASDMYLSFTAESATRSNTPVALVFTKATASRVYIENVESLKLQVSHSSKDNWTLFGAETAGGSYSSEWLFIPQSDTEYRIQTPTQSRYIGGTTDPVVGNTKDTGAGILWSVIDYNATDVTISAAGLATYAPSVALDFTNAEKIAAYKATVKDNTVTLTKVETVAAGEGVLLRSLDGDQVTEAIAVAASATEENADNDFVAVTEATTLNETEDGYTNYVLSQENGVVGFFKANSTNIAAGKAYLKVATSSAAKGIKVVFDGEATGISEVSAAKADEAYYTVSGLRVEKPTKGLYIRGGKKVVVK